MTEGYRWLLSSLNRSWFLWILIVINLFGSIYGFFWYENQLASTSPAWLRWFVPDSPTGSLLFTFFLIALLMGRSLPYLEAFAAVTNFKYGVWAVVMIFTGWVMGEDPHPTDYMLMFSHAGMAAESLLYYRFYSIKFRHIVMVAIWTIGNDLIDYSWDIHPWLPGTLAPFDFIVGIFTLWLSVFSLYLFYRLTSNRTY
jgi:uncharacterized membrane protein YpjA